jgi:hypothetical protein
MSKVVFNEARNGAWVTIAEFPLDRGVEYVVSVTDLSNRPLADYEDICTFDEALTIANRHLDAGYIKPVRSMRNRIALVLASLVVATSAHATSVGGGKHGNHSGYGLGPGSTAAGEAAAARGWGAGANVGATQSGSNGGRYSMVDNYQPWPEDEMRQFQKPAFVPYTGK